MKESRFWLEVCDHDGDRTWFVRVQAPIEQDPRTVLNEVAEKLTALLGR